MKPALALFCIGPELVRQSDPKDGLIGLPTTFFDAERGGEPSKDASGATNPNVPTSQLRPESFGFWSTNFRDANER